MQHINRDCLVVIARQTFVNWLRSVPELEMPNATLDDVNSEALVLLVPHIQSAQAARAYIEPFKADLIRYLFREWSVDESAWPDLEQTPFDHWFTLQYHSMVYDMTWSNVLERDGPEELLCGGPEEDLASYKASIVAEFERTGEWGTPEDPARYDCCISDH